MNAGRVKVQKWFERKDPVLHRALGGSTKTDHGKPPKHDDDDDDDADPSEWQKINPRNNSKKRNDDSKKDKAGEADAVLNLHELATKRRIMKKDKLQRSALHVACANRPTLELVQLLHERYPAGVDEADKVGRLPLHTACAHHADVRVVDYLLQVFPDAIHECTDRGASALFCALENQADLGVIQLLVQADPESVLLTQYKLGRTPVHAAVAG